MISLKQTNQGGSVLTFIIIATVLAVVVISTAFFVKQRGEQVRQQQAATQADKLAKQTDSKDANSSKSSKPATTDGTSKSDGESPAAKPAATTTAKVTTQSATTPQAADLPTTGPELDIIQIVAIGSLAASGVAYATSRRNLGRTL
ncbi:MAG: hypothetical protein ABI716_03205 [Candidatus Saccharibacteria bacterium]